MSTRKNKVLQNFRLDPETLDTIKEMVKTDPLTFRSQAGIVDAALWHFINLNKPEQKEILKEYLTKNL